VSGKPYQSCLIPYRDEIFDLRREKPPVSYARIADLLRQKYGLNVRRAAIGKFVKVRSRGRKVYFFKHGRTPQKPTADVEKKVEQPQPKSKWDFKYSDRYNLKRLPPEEAAAIRKKLEAEGH